MVENIYAPALKLVLRLFCSIFSTLEVIFGRSKVRLPRLDRKRSFSRFETYLTAFSALYLVLWKLFWVDWRYSCQDTGKTFMHWLWNWFYGILCSIFSTLEIILSWSEVLLQRYRRKRSFIGFETCFTAFVVLFLAFWRLFWVDRRYRYKDKAKRFIFRLLNQFYGICCSIFSNMEDILSRSTVLMPRYGQKRSFFCFDTRFTFLQFYF